MEQDKTEKEEEDRVWKENKKKKPSFQRLKRQEKEKCHPPRILIQLTGLLSSSPPFSRVGGFLSIFMDLSSFRGYLELSPEAEPSFFGSCLFMGKLLSAFFSNLWQGCQGLFLPRISLFALNVFPIVG